MNNEMNRTCEKCGTIDYGIYGYLGLLGYSLFIVSMAFALSQLFYSPMLTLVVVTLGVILWIPMFIISIREERLNNENRTNQHR